MESASAVLLVSRTVGASNSRDVLDTMTAHGYRVHCVPSGSDPIRPMIDMKPFVACFEYGHPDLPGLADLQRAKREVPSVPILMLTEGHSESIAIWALRSRVWDYFVKPLDEHRFLSVLEALKSIRQSPSAPGRERSPAPSMQNKIPTEARIRACDNDSGGPLPALDLVLSYIDRNLHAKIVQAEVAKISGLSTFQFSRAFKRQFGITFQEYILRRRISEAMRLLQNSGALITDICYMVGFNDLSYFTRVFHRYTGQPPSKYRMSVSGKGAGERSAGHAPTYYPAPGQSLRERVQVPQVPLQLAVPDP